MFPFCLAKNKATLSPPKLCLHILFQHPCKKSAYFDINICLLLWCRLPWQFRLGKHNWQNKSMMRGTDGFKALKEHGEYHCFMKHLLCAWPRAKHITWINSLNLHSNPLEWGFSPSALLTLGARSFRVMGADLSTAGCPAAPLASAHWMPLAVLSPAVTTQSISRHCQT